MNDSPPRLADLVPKPMRLALVGFAVAAVGVMIALSVEMAPGKPLAYVAFGLAASGIALGFVGIAWGWVTTLRGGAERSGAKGDSAV